MSEPASARPRDNRQWAITLIHLYASGDSSERVGEVSREAMRDVGPGGLVLGLVDVGAHMLENLAGHAGLSLQALSDAMRVNADG